MPVYYATMCRFADNWRKTDFILSVTLTSLNILDYRKEKCPEYLAKPASRTRLIQRLHQYSRKELPARL
jgi:hypothetical protein